MSFSINVHFCGDKVVDVAYFGEAKSCCEKDSIDESKEYQILSSNCCKDITYLLDASLSNKVESVSCVEKTIGYDTVLPGVYRGLGMSSVFSNKPLVMPDLRESANKNLQILHQSFLI